MNRIPDDLLPPLIIREYLKRRALFPVDVITRRKNDEPYQVRISPADTRMVLAWIDAMNAALAGTVEGGLSTCFGAVWIEDSSIADGGLRIEFEGNVL